VTGTEEMIDSNQYDTSTWSQVLLRKC